jgi:hypothetical protein
VMAEGLWGQQRAVGTDMLTKTHGKVHALQSHAILCNSQPPAKPC